MRRLALLCALALAWPAPAVPQTPPVQHSGVLGGSTPADLAQVVPPDRYQADRAAIVAFSHEAVKKLCQADAAIACVKTYADGSVLLVMPNPCPLAGKELYATILCHELGHLNRWPATHGD